jgi:hypothetical protein
MNYIITENDTVRISALTRAAAAYNAANATALTDAQFLQLVCDQNIDAYVAVHMVDGMTQFVFLKRFTQEERVAIRAAAATNGELYDFMQMLAAADEVKVTDPTTIAGVTLLEDAGLIGPGRSAVILAR